MGKILRKKGMGIATNEASAEKDQNDEDMEEEVGGQE